MTVEELLVKNKAYYNVIVIEAILLVVLMLGFLLYKC